MHQLNFKYGSKPILQDISFALSSGQIIGILGPNGSGKTSLLLCLNGFLKPISGQILVQGCPLSAITSSKRARIISFTQQNLSLPYLTTFNYLLTGKLPYLNFLSSYSPEDKQQVIELAKIHNLTAFLEKLMPLLSGGEQRKILFTKTLIQNTLIYLFDEITSNLDPKIIKELLGTIQQLANQGKGIILSLHDLNLAASISNYFIFLKKGRILAQGSPSQVFTQEILEEVYETKFIVSTHPQKKHPIAFPIL
ncbi:MAG: ABC transporter ATP-binding protein [Desulfonauticus sp.]|nr:ABC transporter ATP-binding protein [Desulfonauticus sp.]